MYYFILPLFFTTVVSAAEIASSPKRIECKNGVDFRAIQVVHAEPGGNSENQCELIYTKYKKSRVVASSTNSAEYCHKAADRLRLTLEGGGFVCQTTPP